MAKTSSLKRKRLSEIADLPEEKIQEVIDFVGYLKAKEERYEGRVCRSHLTLIPKDLREPLGAALAQVIQ